MSLQQEAILALSELGFTELEAEVYACLLEESPATGYRVAQITGRLPGNVYKALGTLEAKGAVITDQGTRRQCRAVPVTELLAHLKRRYDQQQARALDALTRIRPAAQDDRIYQLKTVDQVMERCRTMLTRAERIIVADIFPQPLQPLKADLVATAARKLSVTLKTYSDITLPGVKVVLNPHGEKFVTGFLGHWIVLVTDGFELLIASLDSELTGVRQAIWSRSATLGYMFHCSLAAEIQLCDLLHYIHQGGSLDELVAVVAAFMEESATSASAYGESEFGQRMTRWVSLYGKGVPGFEEMKKQFG
jgi:HTH-type transcriptional regulator, sugar sensing transcriptional regulator